MTEYTSREMRDAESWSVTLSKRSLKRKHLDLHLLKGYVQLKRGTPQLLVCRAYRSAKRARSHLLVENDDRAEARLVVHHRVVRVLDLVERVPIVTRKMRKERSMRRTRGAETNGAGRTFATHVSMRVSTPVVIANLIVSSESAAVPAGHPRICNLLPIIGMIGTSTLSPTPLRDETFRVRIFGFAHGKSNERLTE